MKRREEKIWDWDSNRRSNNEIKECGDRDLFNNVSGDIYRICGDYIFIIIL